MEDAPNLSEEELEDQQAKRQRSLLRSLNNSEAFITWRDLAAKPVLDQIEGILQHPMEMTEANLKAQVMYRNLVKGLFYDLFVNVAIEEDIERSQQLPTEPS